MRLACSAQCHPMTPPDVCSRPVLRRRSGFITAPATSRNGARRLILIAGPVVDVTGATGVETTANGVETSLPSAIPGHARMLHLALAPTRLTLDQSVRLLGRCRLTACSTPALLFCGRLRERAFFTAGVPGPCADLVVLRMLSCLKDYTHLTKSSEGKRIAGTGTKNQLRQALGRYLRDMA
jgi:hypothetical protein